jgi:hypothetical protein
MTDEQATTYVVSVFEKPHWRTVLTTKDKDKALRWQGHRRQGEVETIMPKVKGAGNRVQ